MATKTDSAVEETPLWPVKAEARFTSLLLALIPQIDAAWSPDRMPTSHV